MTEPGRPTPDSDESADSRRKLLGPLFTTPRRPSEPSDSSDGSTDDCSAVADAASVRVRGVAPARVSDALSDALSNNSDDSDGSTDDRSAVEFEVFSEGTTLPWEAVLRAWMAKRLPNAGQSKWTILTAVLLGNFAAGIVFTLLSVARSTIGQDLGVPPSLVLWAFTAPSLVAAMVAPSFGRLGDLRGHKRMMLLGLAGGAVTALLVALSPNVGALIFFRALSAIAGASLGPSSLALIFRIFAREDRVKAMGYWALVNAGSPVLGVLIGGPMVDRFGWRSMFFAQIPLFLIALVVGIVVLPETARRAVRRFDWTGATLLGLTTLLVLLAVNRGPAWGWTDPRVVVGFVATPLLLALFVIVEQRVAEPLLPLQLLRVRNVVAGIGAQTFAQFAYLGAGLFLVNDLLVDKTRFGFALSEASRYTIARPICFAVIAPFAGFLAIRRGERFTATLGMSCIFASMVGFAIMRPGASLLGLVAATALAGLGMGISSPSLTASVANGVPESALGVIGAAQQLLTQMGGVIGTQVMVTVVGGDGRRTDTAYHVAFAIAAAMAFASIVCARTLRRSVRGVGASD